MPQSPYQPNSIYHIYNHANGDENLFHNEGNYRYFLVKYAQYLFPVVETYAYCLMPNHFHLLVRVRKEETLVGFYKERFQEKIEGQFGGKTLQAFETLEELNTNVSKVISKQFSDFLNGYTQAFNKQQNRKGNLFQSNTKRKTVGNNRYYTQLVHYIHYNPVHHGFVRDMHDWEFSSYHTYLSNKPTKLNRKEVLDWFGGKEILKKAHQEKPMEKLVLEMEYQ